MCKSIIEGDRKIKAIRVVSSFSIPEIVVMPVFHATSTGVLAHFSVENGPAQSSTGLLFFMTGNKEAMHFFAHYPRKNGIWLSGRQ
ncbi:hypothetical protein BSQ33_00395 [Vibrio gazogenes]|uniref:Uncharacterized protein n=1 Tax=Vibrio gazogenes TaxID=687 RepID=A0A1Z2SAX4_VIBGA|nr:hypothetical protein BSQ33_00395 [Vibrio gazogenes]